MGYQLKQYLTGGGRAVPVHNDTTACDVETLPSTEHQGRLLVHNEGLSVVQ